jgi:TetR/AcrR family transcriptional regulator, cholesterol catabolism regulator
MADAALAAPRRERKKREARRRIYEAAFALFLEKGYDATTVEEIAERADVAKGTVFNYFPRKTSFLAALAEHWTGRVEDALGPPVSWKGSARDQLARLFRLLSDLGARNPDLARLAFFESLRYMHAMVEEHRPHEEPVRHFQALTRTVIRRGQESGEIRRDIHAEDAASLIESAFHQTLAHWLAVGGSRASLHRKFAAKLDIVFTGIARPARRGPRAAARRGGG